MRVDPSNGPDIQQMTPCYSVAHRLIAPAFSTVFAIVVLLSVSVMGHGVALASVHTSAPVRAGESPKQWIESLLPFHHTAPSARVAVKSSSSKDKSKSSSKEKDKDKKKSNTQDNSKDKSKDKKGSKSEEKSSKNSKKSSSSDKNKESKKGDKDSSKKSQESQKKGKSSDTSQSEKDDKKDSTGSTQKKSSSSTSKDRGSDDSSADTEGDAGDTSGAPANKTTKSNGHHSGTAGDRTGQGPSSGNGTQEGDPGEAGVDSGAPVLESRRIPDLEPLPVDALFATRDIGDSAWTPDNKRLVVVTNLSGKPNLWAVDVNGIGWPQQLTYTDIPLYAPQVSPDGRFILYEASAEQSGDETSQRRDLYIIPSVGGTPFNITSTAEFDERNAIWSPNGNQIAYMSDEETPGTYQIYVRELSQGRPGAKARRISRSLQNSIRPFWSPEGGRILISRARSVRDANLVILDVKGGEEQVLTPHQGEQQWLAAGWSPDGNQVLATSNVSGMNEVAVVTVATRQVVWVTRDSVGDARAMAWSRNEKRVAWITNEQGNQSLVIGAPLANVQASPLKLKKGQLDQAQFSPDGRLLAFRYASPGRARDLWIYDLSRTVARQVTFSTVSELRSYHLVEPTILTYPSFDGLPIDAYVYVPHNLPAGARRPVVVWAHDSWLQEESGNDVVRAQFENGFDPAIQWLVSRGFVVFAPNYRGGTGQGARFESLNDRDWGGGDLADLVEGTHFLKRLPYVNADKVAIMGRGYGGYLAWMGLSRSPETWTSGVSIGGMVDLNRVYEKVSPQRKALMKAELGAPEEQVLLWMDRSPRYFESNIRAPLLVIQGSEDKLVSAEDTQALVETLKQRGVRAEYKLLPEDGRLWSGRQGRASIYRLCLGFLEKTLLEGTPGM